MLPPRNYRGHILVALFLTCLCRAASPALGAKAHPTRIVSLAPGITEILYALGLGDKVAGDTTYCDFPPAAKLKPHIGDMVVNYEAVLALRPDLVIADASTNRSAIPRLQALHVPLLIVTSNSLPQVEGSIDAIAQKTGTQARAARVLAGINHDLRLVAWIKNSGKSKTPLRTLVTIGLDPLYVAGTQSFMGDMVRQSGGLDLAGAIAYVPWSKEQAIASQPQAIFCDADDKAALMRDPIWRQTPAVRLGNVFVTNDAYMRPGPRLADAAVDVATDIARSRR